MSKSLPLSVLLVAALAVTGLGDVQAKPRAQAAGPIPVTAADASWGNAHAPVTLISFTDLQCPFCDRLHRTMEALKKDYGPQKIRVVYKHFPLAFHKEARPAAEAADAIWRLKGARTFWKFVDEAFATLPGGRGGDTATVLSAIGVSEASVRGVVARGEPGKKVDEDIDLGKDIGVRGTPATFVNGVLLSGAQPKSKFVEAIDDQLAEAGKLRRQGVPASRVSVALTKKNFVPAEKRDSNKPSQGPGKPAVDDQTVWKVPVGSSPTLGPKDALVTLVVFSDFQCPFCERVKPTLMQLRRDYGDKLRIVFKHNPLPFHKRAEPAAHFTLEAYARKGNKGFWAAHDKLFANQRALEDFDLERYARELGLNPTTTLAAVRNEKYEKQISADQSLASDVEATGTPHHFINGRRLSGAQPITKFEAIIDEEITKARKLVAGGIPAARLYAHIIKKGKTADAPDNKTIPGPSAHSPIKGGKRAKVTITIFSDFQCPYCGRAVSTLEEVDKKYKGKVRFVFRHKPLSFHADAMLAHEAAAEAKRQKGDDAFWKMHDLLFADQRNLDRASLDAHARSIGLNMQAFDRALDSHIHKKAIEKDIDISEDAGIRGTPGFVINGYFISGAQPLSKFEKVVDRALKEAR